MLQEQKAALAECRRRNNGVFNDLNHKPTANLDTASTKAPVYIKPASLQLELAKSVHTASIYAKNHLGLVACFTGKGLYRGFTDPARGL